MKKLNTIQYNCINQATMQNEKKKLFRINTFHEKLAKTNAIN